MDSVQLAAYQKSHARIKAFSEWEAKYHQERMLENARTGWLGVLNVPSRFAYTHTLVEPPSVRHHPLWREATKRMTDACGSKLKRPLYTRRTTSTALQLAVDHAFTGSYAAKFRPSDPPKSLSCKCGAALRDPDHVLRHCPIFHQQRVEAVIHAAYRILTLKQLFNTYPERLMTFLQAPGIARPQTGPHRDWIEEEQEQGIG